MAGIIIPPAAQLQKLTKDSLRQMLIDVSEKLTAIKITTSDSENEANSAIESEDSRTENPTGSEQKDFDMNDFAINSGESVLPVTYEYEFGRVNKQFEEVKLQNRLLTELVKTQENVMGTLQSTMATLLGKLQKIEFALDIDDTDDSESDDDLLGDPSEILLIGDSMVRGVQSTNENLTVNCLSGASFTHIRKELKKVPRKKYRQIIIVCGTNEVSTNRPNERIARECESVLKLAKEKAPTVQLSSIIPRMDEKVENGKIDCLNQLLVPLCSSLDVHFINNDENFKFRNNSIDETLLSADKLHLSIKGVERLIENLCLQTMAKPSAKHRSESHVQKKPKENSMACSWDCPLPKPDMPQPPPNCEPQMNVIKFRGAKNPLSNFYPTTISAWGMNFLSVEQGYTYYKAQTMNEPTLARNIMYTQMARGAKKIGDSIITDQRWQKIKNEVMYYLLQQKAKTCHIFREKLQASQNAVLLEDTENEYWGRGKNGTGENNLGRLLMTIRQDLPTLESSVYDTKFPSPSYPQIANKNNVTQWRPRYTPRPQINPQKWHNGRNRPFSKAQQQNCFNCGEKSHTAESCRHPKPLICYLCSGEGHKRKFCPWPDSHHQ